MATQGDKGRGLLGAIEESPGGGWTWAILLLGWILLRNLLEGILEQPHQMGFDWRGDVSFGMFFLHFPLFYLGLFAVVTLWLHLLTRRSIEKIARAVILGFGLLLLVPVIDHLVSGGTGYDLKYLLGLGSVLWRFWDPTTAIAAASPGQRFEIAAAVFFGGLYVFVARGRGSASGRRTGKVSGLALALVGGLGIYLLIAFLGAWPSLFARLAMSQTRDLGEAYVRVFQLQGLIANESRRYALAMAIPALTGGLLLCWRANTRRFGAVMRQIRWSRLIHYSGLAPAGALLGLLVYREFVPNAYANPIDWVATAILWAAVVAAFVAASMWNDRHDREADQLNEPDRVRLSGQLTHGEAGGFATVSALTALFLAICVSYSAFLLMIACLLLSWFYSCPPLRLKRWPLIATLTLAVLSLISMAMGFSLFAQEMTPLVFPGGVAAFLLLGITLGFTAKDLKDVPGDRATGVITLATLLKGRAARWVTAGLVAFAFLLAPVFLPLGSVFTVIALLFAVVGATLTFYRERPDTLLLGLFFIFALLVAMFLVRDPAVLCDRTPAALQRMHGEQRWIEEEVRVARRLQEEEIDETYGRMAGWSADSREGLLARLTRAFSSVAHASPWEERLLWSRAQLASPKAALVDLERLTRLKPLRSDYLEAQLLAANQADDPVTAIMVCDRGIELAIRPGDFLRNRAALGIGLRRGRLDPDSHLSVDPARDLAGAFLYGQREPLLWVLLGDLTLGDGKVTESINSYRRAATLDAQCADAWSGLGEALHTTQDLVPALDAFEEASRLRPHDPWVLNNLGVVLRDLGRLDEAQTRFLAAHQYEPRLFEPMFNLGQVGERLGRRAEALEWYLQARQVRHGFPPLEEAIRRVETSGE